MYPFAEVLHRPPNICMMMNFLRVTTATTIDPLCFDRRIKKRAKFWRRRKSHLFRPPKVWKVLFRIPATRKGRGVRQGEKSFISALGHCDSVRSVSVVLSGNWLTNRFHSGLRNLIHNNSSLSGQFDYSEVQLERGKVLVSTEYHHVLNWLKLNPFVERVIGVRKQSANSLHYFRLLIYAICTAL